jgi:Secretion system C-terminal sorting domain
LAKVYPNPMVDVLNIELKFKENTEIILYYITHKKIMQQIFSGSVSLNIQELTNGSYFYELRSKMGLIKNGILVK